MFPSQIPGMFPHMFPSEENLPYVFASTPKLKDSTVRCLQSICPFISEPSSMASSVWQLCKPPVHASVVQSGACEKIRGEQLHPQVLFGLRSTFLPIGKVNANFDLRSLLSRQSRKFMATRAAISTGSESTLTQAVDFKKLQNGSDIRGIAVEGVEGESVNLTEAAAEAIGAAFAAWLLDRKESDFSTKLRISLGHDSRISAKSIQNAVARGIAGAGLEVIEYGLASTPAMFNSTLTARDDLFCPVQGAIMITASHLPWNRNGLKFFTSDGGLNKNDISDILARADKIHHVMSKESADSAAALAFKVEHSVDYMEQYTADLVDAVRKGAGGVERPLEGFHVVVDAGNGAGGFFAGRVLERLGASTAGSQFLEPDGMFPNHIPNPEDKKAMEAITKAVLDQKADLGIIFDTDVDRAAAVDSSGRELNRNRLIALLSAIVLEQHPGTTIVTDSVTSDGLTTFIEQKLGGKHHRFKRGYKNVIDEGVRLNSVGEETHLAIETSGHGALKENHWLDDGAYLMVKLLIKLAAAKVSGETSGSQVLSDLIADLEDPAVSSEIRFKIDQSHADIGSEGFKPYGQQVLDKLDQVVASDPNLQKAAVNHEGIRVSGYGGWFLLRLSLHDPVLPLNIEGPSQESTKKLGEFVLATVKEFKALDTSALQKYVA